MQNVVAPQMHGCGWGAEGGRPPGSLEGSTPLSFSAIEPGAIVRRVVPRATFADTGTILDHIELLTTAGPGAGRIWAGISPRVPSRFWVLMGNALCRKAVERASNRMNCAAQGQPLGTIIGGRLLALLGGFLLGLFHSLSLLLWRRTASSLVLSFWKAIGVVLVVGLLIRKKPNRPRQRCIPSAYAEPATTSYKIGFACSWHKPPN